MDYKEFVADAAKNYESLPQETCELYKKHYINIPFELGEYAGRGTGSGDSSIQHHSKFVTVRESSKLAKRFLEDAARSSKGDKYAAYINAHSKSVLFVDVPEGVHAKVDL